MRAIAGMLAVLVVGWSVLARAGQPLPQPTGPVILTVAGGITDTNAPGEARFDREMLDQIGRRTLRTSTPWSDGVKQFEGVSLRAVLERVGAHGSSIKASALNDYHAIIPFDDLKYDLLLAMEMDGQLLTRRDKGPLWIVYPRDSYSTLMEPVVEDRWVWQLNRLEVQ